MGKPKPIVVAGTAFALVGAAGGAILASLPNPQGTSGVSAIVKKVTNAVSGTTDITGQLPPELVQLIQNDDTNKDLLNAIDGVQSCLVSGQNTPGISAADQQNLQTLAPLITTIKFIVQEKGVVKDSQLADIYTVVQNKPQYEAALGALFGDLKQGDPAAVNCVDAFTANNQAMDAVGKLAAASSTPIFRDLGFTPAQQQGFLGAVDYLEGQPLSTEFINAVNAAQDSVKAAQASPQATAAQEKDLATVGNLLSTVQSVAKDHGHLTAADTAAVQSIIQNEATYKTALVDLYNGYQAHDPALVTLARTFEAKDPSGIALIEAFAAKAAVSLPPAGTLAQNADKLGLSILSPQNADTLTKLGIKGGTQAQVRSFLQNRLNS